LKCNVGLGIILCVEGSEMALGGGKRTRDCPSASADTLFLLT